MNICNNCAEQHALYYCSNCYDALLKEFEDLLQDNIRLEIENKALKQKAENEDKAIEEMLNKLAKEDIYKRRLEKL
jgi:hypothetical protein